MYKRKKRLGTEARSVIEPTSKTAPIFKQEKVSSYILSCQDDWKDRIWIWKPPPFTSGSQRGGPWSPGALKFLLWSPEPNHFTDWSPDPFLAVEPRAQRNFLWSPEPSIFKFDHSRSQIALILVYWLLFCLFVGVNCHKETEIIWREDSTQYKYTRLS